MIIKWTQPRALNIYTKAAKKGGKLNLVTIFPSNNQIPNKDWEAYKKLPVVAGLISEGKLLEVFDDKDKGLKDAPEPKAEKIIADTFKEDQLDEWQDTEDRSKVKKAIRKQKKKIEEAVKPKTSED